MTRSHAALALAGFTLLSGCFNPDEVVADTNPTDGGTASDDNGSTTSDMSTDATTDDSTTDPGESTGPSVAECGNGSMEGDEECDDGDRESGDGCSAACLDERRVCTPRLVGALSGQALKRMVFKGGYLYGFRITVPSRLITIDATDPESPSAVDELQIDEDNYPSWNPGDLVASDTHLWTGGNNPELMSIDISTPDAPEFDFFAGPNESDGPVELLGNVLLQAHSVSERINAWDISDPSTPAMLPPIGNPSEVFSDVAAAQNRVIAIGGSHLEIWDISTPAVPMFLGELNNVPWTGTVRSVANADTVVIATTGAGVNVVDYSIPNAPSVATTITDETFPSDIALRGDFVYIPVTNGLRIYDVSNPGDPTLAGSYLEIEVYGLSLALSDEHVYLGTENGIRVLADMPGFCEARCGNNTVEYPEMCDDGNLDDGDGCSSRCINE